MSAGLRLTLDPQQMVEGAARAESALDRVAAAAGAAEEALKDTEGAARMMQGPLALAGNAAFDSFDRLRMTIDPLYAASVRYSEAVSTISLALDRQVISQNEANAAMAAAERTYLRMAPAASQAAEMTGRFSEKGKMLGWQLSQIAQQGAATGQWAQAFAIQAGDMAMILGGASGIGMAIGVLASVSLPLLSMAFGKTGDQAQEVETRINTLMDALNNYNDFADLAGRKTDDLRERFGRFADTIKANAQWMAQVELGKAMSSMKDDAAGLLTTFDQIVQAEKNASDAALAYSKAQAAIDAGLGNPLDAQTQLELLAQYKEDASNLAAAMGLTKEQADQLRVALTGLEGAKGIADIEQKSQAALDVLRAMFPAGEAVPPEIAKIAAALNDVHDAAAQGVATMDDMGGAASGAAVKARTIGEALQGVGAWAREATTNVGGLHVAVSLTAVEAGRALRAGFDMAAQGLQSVINLQPGPDFLSTAIAKAGGLASALWKSASAMVAISNAPALKGPAGMGGTAGTGAATREEKLAADQERAQAVLDSLGSPNGWAAPSVGGGGGGAAAVDTRAAYDALVASLDPAVRASQDLAAAQKTVNDAFAAGTITVEEQARGLTLAQTEFDKTMESIQGVSGAFDDLEAAGATAIDRLIDGYSSVSDVLKDMIRQLEIAAVKQALLGLLPGADKNSSIGSIIMGALTGGFHDYGGTIPMGTTGIVGENGPEIVSATPYGVNVTGRSQTALKQPQPQVAQVQVIGGDLVLTDSGQIAARIKVSAVQAADAAVSTVRRSLSSWNSQLQTDGALA